MRFDDRLDTILALSAIGRVAPGVAWRQLVDLLAQPAARFDPVSETAAMAFLQEHRGGIGVELRAVTARSLTGRAVSPRIVQFFAGDSLTVAAPLLAGARMAGEDWQGMVPQLAPAARNLLRHRTDLPQRAKDALARFGASDLLLESPALAAAQPAVTEGGAQIRELVARIDAFRQQREEEIAAAGADGPKSTPPVTSFRWETGPDGIILWVEDAPRGALVGQAIADVAGGSFARRAPIEDMSLDVDGTGPASGAWLLSGVPFFDEVSGGFAGYRGTARRPAGQGEPSVNALFGQALPADSIRALIHELRTPLNAITGFAEMIDRQMMGPAGQTYRTRAAGIVDQARRLLSAVDDLDAAARNQGRAALDDVPHTDPVAILDRLREDYAQAGAEVAAIFEAADDVGEVSADEQTVFGAYRRLVAIAAGLAAPGESILARLTFGPFGPSDAVCLVVTRPHALGDADEASLLDPQFVPSGDWPDAPMLGVAFALRLVRSLAESVGGRFVIDPQRFRLYLPATRGDRVAKNRG